MVLEYLLSPSPPFVYCLQTKFHLLVLLYVVKLSPSSPESEVYKQKLFLIAPDVAPLFSHRVARPLSIGSMILESKEYLEP